MTSYFSDLNTEMFGQGEQSLSHPACSEGLREVSLTKALTPSRAREQAGGRGGGRQRTGEEEREREGKWVSMPF